jgi:RimJ/RimL family protein N-acetyltransferase
MLAIEKDHIIGECSLHRKLKSRSSHVGELQFYVLPEYRSYGIGFTLLKDVTHIALTAGIEKLYGYIPSKVVSSFERLIGKIGFQQEAILKDFIKDSSGRKQDLFIFGKDLDELWNKIADWQSPYGRAMEF